MADPRFFELRGPFKLGDLAAISGATLNDVAHVDVLITDVDILDMATADKIACLHNPKYAKQLPATKAGAVILRFEDQAEAPKGMPLLITANPYLAYAKILQHFYPAESFPCVTKNPQIHPTAIVDKTAKIGDGCEIEAGAVIAAHVEIGPGSFIGANAVIGRGVVLGQECYVGTLASVSHTIAEDRVVIHTGARIGRSGFGFAHDGAKPVRLPQIGRVMIGQDVEIGANTTIDRGALGDTVIASGTMIDNLVQLGHNVQVGKSCVIVSQVGISGSTKIEDYVQLGGQVGIAGHLTIGKGAKIAAQSGIMRDVEPGVSLCGAPAIPIREFHKQTLTMWRLAKIKGA